MIIRVERRVVDFVSECRTDTESIVMDVQIVQAKCRGNPFGESDGLKTIVEVKSGRAYSIDREISTSANTVLIIDGKKFLEVQK